MVSEHAMRYHDRDKETDNEMVAQITEADDNETIKSYYRYACS